MRKILFAFLLFPSLLQAQEPIRDGIYDPKDAPPPLPHTRVEERDVSYSKIVWREVPFKEKQNQFFSDEKHHFMGILRQLSLSGRIKAYSTLDDNFKTALTKEEIENIFESKDTITCGIGWYEGRVSWTQEEWDAAFIVRNQLDLRNCTRLRIKEGWFFNEATSTMETRIIGIAPIVQRFDDNGNFLNEGPAFWVYYPELRPYLAKFPAFNPSNDAARSTWADIFDKRQFSSSITKQSNVKDARIKDQKDNALDVLIEADKLKEEMRNRESNRYED